MQTHCFFFSFSLQQKVQLVELLHTLPDLFLTAWCYLLLVAYRTVNSPFLCIAKSI